MKEWIPHDGQDCPVDPRSCPAVRFRRPKVGFPGQQHEMQAGRFEARYWMNYARRNCWQWEREGPDDIIAYQEEEGEWVVIPPYPDSVKV